MRRFGSGLMIVGALVGVAAAVWIGVGLERAGLPWLVSVGLVKLTIVASLGLMAAGAMLVRVARRSAAGSTHDQLTAGSTQAATRAEEGREPVPLHRRNDQGP